MNPWNPRGTVLSVKVRYTSALTQTLGFYCFLLLLTPCETNLWEAFYITLQIQITLISYVERIKHLMFPPPLSLKGKCSWLQLNSARWVIFSWKLWAALICSFLLYVTHRFELWTTFMSGKIIVTREKK